METIKSFQIDHNKLQRGVYTSRTDGDVITYDLRMKLPNREPVMRTGSLHAIEHIGATYLRNSPHKDKIIYFGPMGCRTGFYLIVRSMSLFDVSNLVRDLFRQVAEFKGDIPGASPVECGNYSDMDLDQANADARQYLLTLESLQIDNVFYPS